MESLGKFLQTGDWKGEKHVPVIHCPEKVRADEGFDIMVTIGDAIKHPNTLEHHISWIKVFYFGDDAKFPVELATFSFTAHGEAGAFDEPVGVAHVKLHTSGKIFALSYCNIHGLWENNVSIKVE